MNRETSVALAVAGVSAIALHAMARRGEVSIGRLNLGQAVNETGAQFGKYVMMGAAFALGGILVAFAQSWIPALKPPE